MRKSSKKSSKIDATTFKKPYKNPPKIDVEKNIKKRRLISETPGHPGCHISPVTGTFINKTHSPSHTHTQQ